MENIPIENRKILIKECVTRINNWMDDCFVAEHFQMIDNSNNNNIINVIDSLLGAIQYRYGQRAYYEKEVKNIYDVNIKEIKKLKKEIAQNLIINNDFVTKAYITPDRKFLKVETKNNVVFTIWEKFEGYQMSTPIQPNNKTGSSMYVMGEGEWDYGTFEQVIEIIENGQNNFPNFFSKEDRETTHFLTIEQAVNIHGNILNFKKVK